MPKGVPDTTDWTGIEVGWLTPIQRVGKSGWLCLCRCGNTCVKPSSQLGNVLSCGCMWHKWEPTPSMSAAFRKNMLCAIAVSGLLPRSKAQKDQFSKASQRASSLPRSQGQIEAGRRSVQYAIALNPYIWSTKQRIQGAERCRKLTTFEGVQLRLGWLTNAHILLIHTLHEQGTSIAELAMKFDRPKYTITDIVNYKHRPLNFTDYEIRTIFTAFNFWLQSSDPPPTNYRLFTTGRNFGNGNDNQFNTQ